MLRRLVPILLAAALAAADGDDLRAVLQADVAAGSGTGLQALLAPEVRTALPAERLAAVHRTLLENHGPLESVEPVSATPGRRTFRLVFEHGTARAVVNLDAQGRIVGYWIRPEPPDWSLEEIHRRLDALPGDYGYHRVVLDSQGKVVAEDGRSRGREVFPLGSIFKLYVLVELARQVDAGTITLDEELEVVERWKSLPSGQLQLRPAGSKVTVRDAARAMIAISDNTAADLLIHRLGRREIEKRLALWHNSVPERNTPFLTTREMFLVKGGGKERETFGIEFPELVERWRKGTPDERRAMVAKLCAPFDEMPLAQLFLPVSVGYELRATGQPIHGEIEWFARPADIVALVLDAQRGTLAGSATFLDFYGAGSPVYPPEELTRWGFKGGSERDVFALSALAVGKEGRTVAVCLCRAGTFGRDYGDETVALFTALLRLGLRSGA